MKTASLIVFPLVYLSGALDAYAACDACPQPAVGIYDFDVTVAPVSLQESKDLEFWNWTQLYRIAGRAGAVVSGSDKSCIRYLAGAAFQDTSGVPSNNPLVVGVTNPVLPPAGAMRGMDYLFTGRVENAAPGYKVNMALEGACSRKPLVSRTFAFTDADAGLDAAEATAKEGFGHLFSAIREQERQLRDSDTRVAICAVNGKGLQVEPVRTRAKPFEKVPVRFTLTDCDGAPLAGRIVHLVANAARGIPASHNGNYDVQSVTTDGNGTAVANFTLAGGRDAAVPRAWFEYLRPSGCDDYTMDESLILVEGSAQYYEVKFEYEMQQQERYTSTVPMPGGSVQDVRRADQSTRMRCRGYWQNSEDAVASGDIELTGRPEFSCHVVGRFDSVERSGSLTEIYEESSGPGLTDVSMEILGRSEVQVFGEPIPDRAPDLYFTIKPKVADDSAQFSLSVPFRFNSTAKAESLTRVVGGGAVIETPESDESENSWTSDLPVGGPDMRFVSKEFEIEVASEFVTTERDGETLIQRTGKLKAVIRPFM